MRGLQMHNSFKELQVIHKYLIHRYVLEDVDRQWPNLDVDEDGYVTWEEYRNRTYGFMSGKCNIVDSI